MSASFFCAAVVVAVASGPSSAFQNPPRTPPGHISGVVVEDGTNVPVPHAKVSYVPADAQLFGDANPPEAMTDDDGRFTFRNVPPGHYRILAESETFAPQFDMSAFPLVDLDADQDVTNVTVLLSHGGAITGKVTGLDGRPVSGTHAVALLKRLDITSIGDPPLADAAPMTLPLGQAETNDRGEFRLERLPAGDYLVAAEAAGGRAGSLATGTTYYPGATEQSAARVVSVRAGQTVKDITIHMAAVRTYRVSGTVVDSDGMPVPGAFVSLMPDLRGDSFFALIATGRHDQAQSNGDGLFVFENIPRGSYIVGSAPDDGVSALTGTVVIDSTGSLTVKTNGRTLPLAAGTAAVRIRDADVTDVKVVAKKQK